jgi:hypothetical protein
MNRTLKIMLREALASDLPSDFAMQTVHNPVNLLFHEIVFFIEYFEIQAGSNIDT